MISKAKSILSLFKLRIGVAMVLTTMAGMAVTPGAAPALWESALILIAVLFSSAAAGALNHWYDFDIDASMERTQGRPFVTGALKRTPAWLWLMGAMLALPTAAVAVAINIWAALFVFLGAFFYGVVYTIWLKRRTWLNIVIGGLAGSFAVLAGAAVVDPSITPIPMALAFVLFLWTPSHFWSLAIAMKPEYAAAKVPMLPVVAGEETTARAIFGNTVLLVAASLLPAFLGMGWVYLAAAAIGGLYFLFRTVKLIQTPTPKPAMASFFASLIQLALLLAGAFLDSQLIA